MVVHPYNSESKSYIHIGEGRGCHHDDDDDDRYHHGLFLLLLLLFQKAVKLKHRLENS